MKSFIKSSFSMLLLMAILTLGFSSANAKTPTKDIGSAKTHKVTSSQDNLKTISLRCHMQSMANLAVAFTNNSQPSLKFITNLLQSKCEAKTYRNGNYVLIISSDCKYKRKKIDPTKD